MRKLKTKQRKQVVANYRGFDIVQTGVRWAVYDCSHLQYTARNKKDAMAWVDEWHIKEKLT